MKMNHWRHQNCKKAHWDGILKKLKKVKKLKINKNKN